MKQKDAPMKNIARSSFPVLTFVTIFIFLLASSLSIAAGREEIDFNARKLLDKLIKETPIAQALSERAVGILVFPIISHQPGMQYLEGALIKNGKITGYYSSKAAHHGGHGGRGKLGYALFFMSNKALGYLDKGEVWEVGTGPSIEIVDEEMAAAFGKSLTTSFLTKDIYAFILCQKGLLPEPSPKGTKISGINPK
jgi:hypothetical protein